MDRLGVSHCLIAVLASFVGGMSNLIGLLFFVATLAWWIVGDTWR